MTSTSDLTSKILTHCLKQFTSLKPLIDKEGKRTSIYREKTRLMEAGWLEIDGKDRYHTTQQGVLQLQAVTGEAPKGLIPFYPPLAQVPTPQHKAGIELVIAAVIARRNGLRNDRHPAFLIVGPTLTWKTSLGLFLCYMLGLDPSLHIVNLAAETGRSLWIRKNATGGITFKRELLDAPLVIFDEYQTADADCKRFLNLWIDGRKEVAVENQKLTISAVSLIILNPKEGESLEIRLGFERPQIRRILISDLKNIKIPNLALRGEDILQAAKMHGPIDLPKPRAACGQYKPQINDLLSKTLNQEGRELVDLETLVMLSGAMSAFFDPIEAIRLVLYDTHLLYETIGWTQPNWTKYVNQFPMIQPANFITDQSDRKDLLNADRRRAFQHLENGGTSTELVTILGFPVGQAKETVDQYLELKRFDFKTQQNEHQEDGKTQDIQQLEHDVKVAELKKQKAELEQPLKEAEILKTLITILDEEGRWRQENCNYLINNLCTIWSWEKEHKPSPPIYWVGDPFFQNGRWYILPTYTKCASCPKFLEKGTQTVVILESRISSLEKFCDNHSSRLAALDKKIANIWTILNPKIATWKLKRLLQQGP